MRSRFTSVLACISLLAATGIAGSVNAAEILNIGAEEVCGNFNGVRPSIDIDSKGQPHIIVDTGHIALGSTMYMFNKIDGSWSGRLFVDRSSTAYSPSAISQPWIEIDSQDRAWIFAQFFQASVMRNSGQGVWLYTNMGTSPAEAWFNKKQYGSYGWGPGNIQIDPFYPNEAVVMTMNGDWGIVDSTGTTTATGRMGPGASGEKFRFRLSPRDGERGVWHGVMNGSRAGGSSAYRNSEMGADMVWATYNPYSSQGDDHNHAGVCGDTENPQIAYLASVYGEFGDPAGLHVQVYDGAGDMIRGTDNLLNLDPHAKFIHRCPPATTVAHGGGCWIAWPDEHGSIYMTYVSPDAVATTPTRITSGAFCGIRTDDNGDVHMAYIDNGQTKYRKIDVSGGRYESIFGDELVDLGDGWYRSEWFGTFTDLGGNWIYHTELGTAIFFAQDTSSIWMRMNGVGWGWTSKNAFPFMYSATDADWIMYARATTDPRYFYRFAYGMWTTDQQSQAILSTDTTALTPICIEGENAAADTFDVWNSGDGFLNYRVSDSVGWLSVTPASGDSVGEHDPITVAYDTDALASGEHTATITVWAPGANGTPIDIDVTLTVNQNPTLAVDPAELSQVTSEGDDAPDQSFDVFNSGEGIFSYTVTETSDWFSVSSADGTITGQVDTITVDYDPTGLGEGIYNGTITVESGDADDGSPQTIDVQLEIQAAPALDASPADLTAECDLGENPGNDVFEVSNSGGGTLEYTISDDADWLAASPASGSSTGEVDNIEVVYSAGGLAPGTHNATITVEAPGRAGSPQTVDVELTVLHPILSVSTTLLNQIVSEGQDADDVQFSVSNVGHYALFYEIAEDAPWLSVDSTSGVSVGESDLRTVSFDTSELPSGEYPATITVSGSDIDDQPAGDSPQEITVNLNVI